MAGSDAHHLKRGGESVPLEDDFLGPLMNFDTFDHGVFLKQLRGLEDMFDTGSRLATRE